MEQGLGNGSKDATGKQSASRGRSVAPRPVRAPRRGTHQPPAAVTRDATAPAAFSSSAQAPAASGGSRSQPPPGPK